MPTEVAPLPEDPPAPPPVPHVKPGLTTTEFHATAALGVTAIVALINALIYSSSDMAKATVVSAALLAAGIAVAAYVVARAKLKGTGEGETALERQQRNDFVRAMAQASQQASARPHLRATAPTPLSTFPEDAKTLVTRSPTSPGGHSAPKDPTDPG